ncbi:MAG: esterase family protein [Planctomycetes bacterium]|nr:esterase family protein [Planctomycetota bacterium]
MNVILPDAPRGRLPVLVLLHGLSDDYTAWQRYTRLEKHAERRALIIAMPDGARSFYVNSPAAGAYEDCIVKDVLGTVERLFPAVGRREGRAIAGLSMGGFGAMLLGLKHPGRFAAISSHSGAFVTPERLRERPMLEPLVPALVRRENDCRAAAKAVAEGRRRPAIRFDCGVDDGLLDANRAFHAHLDRVGLDHEYHEYPGAHTWDYWDRHIVETLDFVAGHTRGG